jgi:hypothetical protein
MVKSLERVWNAKPLFPMGAMLSLGIIFQNNQEMIKQNFTSGELTGWRWVFSFRSRFCSVGSRDEGACVTTYTVRETEISFCETSKTEEKFSQRFTGSDTNWAKPYVLQTFRASPSSRSKRVFMQSEGLGWYLVGANTDSGQANVITRWRSL